MPAEYEVEFGPAAIAAMAELSHSDRQLVTKQAEDKLQRAPDQVGQPLGNKMGFKLAGLRKLYIAKKRLRIIYEVNKKDRLVTIVVVGPREGARVYAIADAEMRRRRLRRIV